MPVKEVVTGLYSNFFADWRVHIYYLVDQEGVTIIDTGGAGSTPRIIEGLADLGKGVEDVRRIVLTHGHQDHAGSAAQLAAATGAPVHVHAADAAHVREGTEYEPLKPRTLIGRMMLLGKPPRSVEATPGVEEMADGDVVSGMRVVHTPGHSPGHVVLLWPRHGGVLMLGDAAFNFGYLAAAHLYEDLELMWSSLRRISRLDFQVACFGHGRPLKRAAAERFRKKFVR